MKSFILMFPFQTASISFPEGSFIFPGSSIDFLGKIQNAAPDIDVLFHEHSPLEAEEIADFKKHQSLYFLKGSFKSLEEFNALNKVILNILNEGALGVYMEHSGTAWSKQAFIESYNEEDFFSLWLNFIQKEDTLFSLGMAAFDRADLCIRIGDESLESRQDTLLTLAESLFLEESTFETGVILELGENESYRLLKETNVLFNKKDLEFNPKGVWRLMPKK